MKQPIVCLTDIAVEELVTQSKSSSVEKGSALFAAAWILSWSKDDKTARPIIRRHYIGGLGMQDSLHLLKDKPFLTN